MVRIENSKTIIEIDNFQDFEHDFAQDLQYDLIELMNCMLILKNMYDPDLVLSRDGYTKKLDFHLSSGTPIF